MSALPPKADIAESDRHVRFVPKADIRVDCSRRVARAGRGSEFSPNNRVIDRAERVDFGIGSPGASPRPEAFCGLLATLGDFIHSDQYHPWTLPMNGAHNFNAAR